MEHISIESFFVAFGLTLLAGLSTAIGASLVFLSKADNKKFLSIGLGFSAGVMIYVSFIEILMKSKNAFNLVYGEVYSELLMVICFFGGILFAALIDKFIPEDVNPHELKSYNELKNLNFNANASLIPNLKRTGVFTAIAISIHNFPEGFATFVASLENITLGISIAIAIALHNIPEGMSVSLPIYHSTGSKSRAFKYAFLSGLAEPIGAIIGFFILMPLLGHLTLAIIFGFVAGIMIYISFDELLPSARVYGDSHTTILGLSAGMLVVALSLIAFKL